MAPYFTSRVSEAASNLSELAERTVVYPIMHIPGNLNPADIATRALAKPENVQQGSVWQNRPEFLFLPRTDWPLSRDFLYSVPDQGLRSSKAVFNMLAVESQTGFSGISYS